MTNTSGLRTRLTLAYALALAGALIIFAAGTLAVVHHLQRVNLDAQLLSAVQADRAIADVSRGRLVVDPLDRQQFSTVPGTRVSSAVLDENGRILASSVSVVPQVVVSVAMAHHEPTFAGARAAGDRLRLRVQPLIVGERRVGTIVVWQNVESISELDARLALLFAIAIPFIVATAMLVAGEIARRGLLPLDRMARVAASIEARDLTQRLDLPARNDELGRLAATFDRMLDRLQQAFEREQRFTSDASHELRAPLSIILAETEFALVRERDPAEYRRALETIALEADALENLTRRLLAVARSENEAPARRETIDVAELAENVVQRVAPLARSRQVALAPALAPALVEADAEELERALLTVVHNAVKFARTEVTVRVARTAGDVVVEIGDDGPGFSAAALVHGVERFWREEDGNPHGSGLGLAIARAIVERCGGTLVLANHLPHGALVTLRLPLYAPGGASNS